MAYLDPADDRALIEAERAKMAVCGACGSPMAGPGTCRVCIALGDRVVKMRPRPGTRHVRRRAAGVSRSKAGR